MHNGTTITQFIIEEQRHIQGASGDFTSLLNDGGSYGMGIYTAAGG